MFKFKSFSIILGVFALAIVLAACKPGDIDQFIPSSTGSDESTQGSEASGEAGDTVTITVTDTGFEPASAVVSTGGTINWVNDTSSAIQIGSANHPTHTINQDITGDEFVVKIDVGASQSVTVIKSGTWGYHNHLKPSMFGSVSVE